MNDVELICPQCGAPMVLKETARFKYKNGKNRKFYSCSRFPACRSAHGADPDGNPLGIPAKSDVKEMRIKAHNAFDALWKNGMMERGNAYGWLSKQFGKMVHIGSMGKDECGRVIQLCRNKVSEGSEREVGK